MIDLYRKALCNAGYDHVEPTAENVRACFLDYVDAGVWANVDPDDVDGINVERMAKALAKLR